MSWSCLGHGCQINIRRIEDTIEYDWYEIFRAPRWPAKWLGNYWVFEKSSLLFCSSKASTMDRSETTDTGIGARSCSQFQFGPCLLGRYSCEQCWLGLETSQFIAFLFLLPTRLTGSTSWNAWHWTLRTLLDFLLRWFLDTLFSDTMAESKRIGYGWSVFKPSGLGAPKVRNGAEVPTLPHYCPWKRAELICC